MKRMKIIINSIFYVIIAILICYIVAITLAPKKTSEILGYQFYTVYTNSMEPTIPTYSLVGVKKFKENEKLDLKPQQIITFNADRFGENIVVTHRFNKIERDENGTVIYRTNAEGKENLDMYQTTRNDLIGTYSFHIPYIGKIVLFLKSKFGFILYGELLIIFLINSLIRAIWEEKNNETSTMNWDTNF